jgi:hypothetical protein
MWIEAAAWSVEMPLFTNITSAAGIHFRHRASHTSQKYLIETMGSVLGGWTMTGTASGAIAFRLRAAPERKRHPAPMRMRCPRPMTLKLRNRECGGWRSH